MLRLLTNARFTQRNNVRQPNRLFKCDDVRCKLCRLYIQECTFFYTSNNVRWDIKEHITCHAKCTLYYLKCLACNITSYTGKTNIFRQRMNNHISDCRTGNSTDRFDLHVHDCIRKHNRREEPFFQIFIFMTVHHENMLITYEKYLHHKQFDTMN